MFGGTAPNSNMAYFPNEPSPSMAKLSEYHRPDPMEKCFHVVLECHIHPIISHRLEKQHCKLLLGIQEIPYVGILRIKQMP